MTKFSQILHMKASKDKPTFNTKASNHLRFQFCMPFIAFQLFSFNSPASIHLEITKRLMRSLKKLFNSFLIFFLLFTISFSHHRHLLYCRTKRKSFLLFPNKHAVLKEKASRVGREEKWSHLFGF